MEIIRILPYPDAHRLPPSDPNWHAPNGNPGCIPPWLRDPNVILPVPGPVGDSMRGLDTLA